LRPHVTLARRAAGARPSPLPPALHWPVQAYALVQSLPGPPGGYRVLCRYPAAQRT
jgi:2'-5' RNA ligase